MPEGDIHRATIALRTALVGKPTLAFRARGLLGPAPTIGRTIESVECHGRHVEIVWDDGLTLHSNLRLSGVWHLYRSTEMWRRRTDQMRVSIEIDGWVAVCFSAPVVETYRQFDRHRHPGSGRLGPDLCRDRADRVGQREAVDRLVAYPDPAAFVGEALLDQHVARGIGNVFRSEVLWAVELSPFAAVGALTRDDATAVIAEAVRLLQDNISGDYSRRVHRLGVASSRGHHPGLGVYGRNGQRCDRCGDTVQVKRVA
ncbi:MAG TPA: hypothetical protein PLV68_20350, partial [Ilumatobacteraceae bacterium]|nr:hypothetical protein [Ilumatobacteraceae bacterium]